MTSQERYAEAERAVTAAGTTLATLVLHGFSDATVRAQAEKVEALWREAGGVLNEITAEVGLGEKEQ